VFLCTVLSLVGDYYKHITIVKLHPEPAFAFNKVNNVSEVVLYAAPILHTYYIPCLFNDTQCVYMHVV